MIVSERKPVPCVYSSPSRVHSPNSLDLHEASPCGNKWNPTLERKEKGASCSSCRVKISPRLERENALNQRASLKDRRNHPQLRHQVSHHSRRKDQTYTKRHRQKLLQGSLENVSSNPLGDHRPPESTLRRSRSLAISREDVFTNLDIPNPTRARRRSQLIPRAKLIDRCNNNSSRSSLQRGISHESLYTDQSTLSVFTRGPLEYAAPQQQAGFKYREDVSGSQYLPSVGHLRHSTTDLDSLEHDAACYKPQPQQVSSHQHQQHTEDSGLSLPNYYPDSKCDTDHSFTDNVSVGNFARDSKYRQSSLYPESGNIYDENIVLSKNQLYDKVEEHYHQSKPRTIRGNTPYYKPEPETYVKPRSLPNFANGYESDSTLSDYDPKYYEPVERTSSDSNNEARPIQHLPHDSDHYQHHQQQQQRQIEEAPIVQELRAEKEESAYYGGEPQVYSHYQQHQIGEQQQPSHYHEEHETKSEFSNIEANPIYDEIPVLAADKDLNKTSIQVPPQEDTPAEYQPDEYKTVVSVPEPQKSSSDEEDVKEAKKHSHNYLKEFLETQKGSKKPLQNFLSKRISRAFNATQEATDEGTKASSKTTNLIENQYFSLPDITVSKNLQKCEKIDRKLRKCEKLQKSPSDVSTNRFIVNIGNHFDVTARSSIPVDFELKISKIPKTKKSKSDKNFVDAVKILNQTLNTDQKSNPKLIVNGEEINTRELFQRDKEVEVLIEDTKMSSVKDVMNKEFQAKINTMRNYWGNMVGKEQKEEKQDPIKEVVKEQGGKCKIVGMQTKIEEVKKKFEADPYEKGKDEEEAKPPSKVQMTKQFFENNDAQIQKATSKQGLVENPYFDNHFESLNPNTLELIEHDDKYEEINARTYDSVQVNLVHKPEKNVRETQAAGEIKEVKDVMEIKEIGPTEVEKHEEKPPVKKSKPIEPEFDHIRYRVVKSDLFQKKIFAKCEKESQFDGLMQYLQDYSFQELLIDNNIVIIEPIRTNIQYVGTNNAHHPNKVTKFIRTPGKPPSNNESTGLRKHFFYHPIRVNREVNDDELPNPDTVKQVRQMFEGQMPRSQSSKHLDALTKQTVQYIRPVDPDKDRCSASGGSSNMSDCDENDEYDEEADACCEYVSEDILEKIRECGTSVTYYGGRVTAKRKPQAMTKAIMDEIQTQRSQKSKCNCSCKFKMRDPANPASDANGPNAHQEPGTYQGVKFKLLKSNSCSSRLELVGTKNLGEYRQKFMMKQKQILDEHNLKKQNLAKSVVEKNHINESIKEVNMGQSNVQTLNGHHKANQTTSVKENGHKPFMTTMDVHLVNGNSHHKVNHVTNVSLGSANQSPKIIGQEMKTKKLIQWGEMREDNRTYSGITYTHNHTPHNNTNKKTFDFYEKVKIKSKKAEEMEFEPYEIAN